MWLNHCASFPGATCGAVVAHGPAGGTSAVPVVEFSSPPPGNYHWSDILAARGLPPVPIEGTLVGPRLAYQSHFLTDSDDSGALAALIEEIRRPGMGGRRPSVAMYLSTDDVLAAHKAGVRAVPVLLEPDAWINVPQGGWEAWVGSLPSKRRNTVRREVRSFEDAGLRIRHVGLPECWERLPEVANSMAIKYGYSARTPDFIAEFGKYLESSGASARVALCTKGNEEDLLGFCMYYIHADAIYLRWVSFNYDLLTGSKEYFNLTYYDQVRLAVEVGAGRIHVGKKALDAKVLRGAHLRPLWMLDLTEDSVLEEHAEQVREHNARQLSEVEADPRLVKAIIDRAEWEVFC
jgi:predicted N-acyltransferase